MGLEIITATVVKGTTVYGCNGEPYTLREDISVEIPQVKENLSSLTKKWVDGKLSGTYWIKYPNGEVEAKELLPFIIDSNNGIEVLAPCNYEESRKNEELIKKLVEENEALKNSLLFYAKGKHISRECPEDMRYAMTANGNIRDRYIEVIRDRGEVASNTLKKLKNEEGK